MIFIVVEHCFYLDGIAFDGRDELYRRNLPKQALLQYIWPLVVVVGVLPVG